jgi:hypothetical protein
MYDYFKYQINDGYMKIGKLKTPGDAGVRLITEKEIKRNIGFLGTKGALLKSLMKEKKVERLK